jgi:hypothetical protein
MRTVLAFGILGTFVLLAYSLWPTRSGTSHQEITATQRPEAANHDLAAISVPAHDQGLVYPYSVVPGGVRTPQELQEASKRDPLVGRHYSGFNFKNAHVVELQKPQLVYVSYRLKGKIYWTKKKVALRKGEKVITDGKMMARTRCANQASSSVQKEVSSEEPPAGVLEDPYGANGSSLQVPYPGNLESSLMNRSGLLPTLASPGAPGTGLYAAGGSGGYPGIFPPPLPIGKSGGSNPPPPPPPPPPPQVPEPGTVILFSSGLAAIYAKYRASRK